MLTPYREVRCFVFKVREVRQCWEQAHTCISFLRDLSSQLKLDKDRTPLEVFWKLADAPYFTVLKLHSLDWVWSTNTYMQGQHPGQVALKTRRSSDSLLHPQQPSNLWLPALTPWHHCAEGLEPLKSPVSKYWLPLYKWRNWGIKREVNLLQF